MNIIETAKAILHGDADIDPMVIVRAVARLEPVAYGQFYGGKVRQATVSESKARFYFQGDDPKDGSGIAYAKLVYLYTLEADK